MQLQVVALQPHPAQKARPVNLLRALQQDHEKKNKKKNQRNPSADKNHHIIEYLQK